MQLCRYTVAGLQYLSNLFEGLRFDVGEDVAFRHGEDLEGHGTVVVLQWGDIVVAHGQLGPSVNLIPDQGEEVNITSSEEHLVRKG